MKVENREKLLRVSGMLDGLAYAVRGDIADGLACAIELVDEVLESEVKCCECENS